MPAAWEATGAMRARKAVSSARGTRNAMEAATLPLLPAGRYRHRGKAARSIRASASACSSRVSSPASRAGSSRRRSRPAGGASTAQSSRRSLTLISMQSRTAPSAVVIAARCACSQSGRAPAGTVVPYRNGRTAAASMTVATMSW